MTIDEHISNFLRDAQYRIAQLSVEMDKLQDEGSYRYQVCFKQRLKLIIFMNLLFEGKWFIADGGYNHIQYGDTDDTWTETELIHEIEELRYYTNMNEVPYITFTAHYPQIASYLGTAGPVGSGTEFPSGEQGDTIFYNFAGVPYADNIDPWAGPFHDQTIDNYFLNRP
jgi:hypothetical protein